MDQARERATNFHRIKASHQRRHHWHHHPRDPRQQAEKKSTSSRTKPPSPSLIQRQAISKEVDWAKEHYSHYPQKPASNHRAKPHLRTVTTKLPLTANKQASKQADKQAKHEAEPSTICTITLTIPTSRESTAEHPCQLPHRKYPGFRKPGVAHPVPLVARTLTCLITFRH